MKTLVGGEITGYTEMLIEARQIATKRMVDEAEALGGGRGHQRPVRLGLGDAGGRRGHRLRNRSAVQVTQLRPAPCSLKRAGTALRTGRHSRRPAALLSFPPLTDSPEPDKMVRYLSACTIGRIPVYPRGSVG